MTHWIEYETEEFSDMVVDETYNVVSRTGFCEQMLSVINDNRSPISFNPRHIGEPTPHVFIVDQRRNIHDTEYRCTRIQHCPFCGDKIECA